MSSINQHGTFNTLSDCAACFYSEHDMNCAESIILGVDDFYALHLDRSTLRVAAGFGGGLCVGSLCGAVSGAIMALGVLYVKERAHESEVMKCLVPKFLHEFENLYGSLDCTTLKEQYHKESCGCVKVVNFAAALLEQMIREYDHPLIDAKR